MQQFIQIVALFRKALVWKGLLPIRHIPDGGEKNGSRRYTMGEGNFSYEAVFKAETPLLRTAFHNGDKHRAAHQ
jgi:hypothetical protein